MRVDYKGRVTIPKDLRDYLEIGEGDEVIFQVSDNGDRLVLRKVDNDRKKGDRDGV